MKVRTYKTFRQVEDTVIEYVASDDVIFKTEEDCLRYEAALEKVNKLIIRNPDGVLPYDTYTSSDKRYMWVNIENNDDIETVKYAYELDVEKITPGIYCIEEGYDGEFYISSIDCSIDNAIALLRLAGYDTSTLKRKDETDNG